MASIAAQAARIAKKLWRVSSWNPPNTPTLKLR